MRDRLIELLRQIEFDYSEECVCAFEDGYKGAPDFAKFFVDHLLDNGVIVPPCKAGDTVYKVVADKRVKKPYECKVVGFWFSELEGYNNAHLVRYVNGVFDSSFSVPIGEFGKTVFLTKEESEKALAEENNK